MENQSNPTIQQSEQKPKISSQSNLVKHIVDNASVSGDDGKELANWTVTGDQSQPAMYGALSSASEEWAPGGA